jgi:hypothetical protein
VDEGVDGQGVGDGVVGDRLEMVGDVGGADPLEGDVGDPAAAAVE